MRGKARIFGHSDDNFILVVSLSGDITDWRSGMKKKLIVFSSVCLALVVSLSAEAGLFTYDQATLAGMSKTWAAGGTTASEVSTEIVGDAVRFSADLQSGNGVGDGWASMGVGYGWPPPVGLRDLSAYDGVTLTFLNTNQSSWLVNVYVNTGWTDAPYSETDQFNQSGWQEIAPGVATTIILDFAAVGANNLNHVTNIGFEVGGNMEDYPYESPLNPSNPDAYHIDVTSVPEPVTLVLLGLGGLMLRKRN